MDDERGAGSTGPEGTPREESASSSRSLLRRHIDNARAIVLTEGDFAPLLAAWRRHSELWDLPTDGLSEALIRQGLAAASLHLANRPRDEICAWTINLRQPPTNVFLTGDARNDRVAGRAFTEGVRTLDMSRLYVQTIRPGRDPAESTIEVHGLDVLGIFEQYYERSEQNPARFFEEGEDRFLMVLGLPGVNRSWLKQLTLADARHLFDHGLPLENRAFHFECGCSPRRMLDALRGIFSKDPQELFQGEERVEASCPRCGRRWWVSIEQFLANEPPDAP